MNPAVVWKLNDTITTPNFSTERIIVEVRWQINNRLRRTTTCVKNMATSKTVETLFPRHQISK